MNKKPIGEILLGIFFVIMLCYSSVSAGESIQITDAHFLDDILIINGTNFDSFGQISITVGDTLLSACEVATSKITCDIFGTPAADGGSWRVSVSAGNAPHLNATIDAFNLVEAPAGCIPGDYTDCYPGEVGTKGVGICKSGTRTCLSSGMWGSECIGHVGPQEESPLAVTCRNGLDDDCDGLIDIEDDDCCGIIAEVCDGLDNNCNGKIDENVNAVEYCNGKDDNCNGFIDEGFDVGDYCTVGVGECMSSGTITCENGGAICDASPGTPVSEKCNGKDDDCDGLIDDIPVAHTTECCEWHTYSCGAFLTEVCHDCIKTYDSICANGTITKVCQ